MREYGNERIDVDSGLHRAGAGAGHVYRGVHRQQGRRLAGMSCCSVRTGAGSSSAQGRGSDVLAQAGVGTGDAMSQTGSP